MDHSRNNPWRFNNHSTIMQVLFIPPSDTLFSNIDHTHTVSNGKGESVVFDKRYYSLSHMISMFNQMQFILLSIFSTASSYGCIHIDSNCSFDYSKYLISSIFWI